MLYVRLSVERPVGNRLELASLYDPCFSANRSVCWLVMWVIY